MNAIPLHSSVKGPSLAPAALVVAGMHRSGTSALARVLALAGSELPKTLMAPGFDNPKGFWESPRIAAENDRVLEYWGSSWDDVLSFLAPRAGIRNQNAIVERFQAALAAEYSLQEQIVLKEPRMALLLDGWIEALQRSGMRPKIVLPLRNPLEVAASLHARNGFAIGKGLLLWLAYTLAAEASSRSCARVFISYDHLLGDWRGVLSRCQSELGVPFPRWSPHAEIEIDAFVSSSDRHHRIGDEALGVRADVSHWVRVVYASLCAAAVPGGAPDTGVLDTVAKEFAGSAKVFSPIIADLSARVRTSETTIDRLSSENLRDQGELAELRASLEESNTRSREAETRVHELGERTLGLQSQLEDLEFKRAREAEEASALNLRDQGELAELRASLEESNTRSREAETRVHELGERTLGLQSQLEDLEFKRAREAEEASALLDQTRERLVAVHAALADQETRNVELSSLLAETQERLRAGEGKLSAGLTERADLETVLAQTNARLETSQREAADQSARFNALMQLLEETRERLGATVGGVAERDGRIIELTQLVSELYGKIGTEQAAATAFRDQLESQRAHLATRLSPMRRLRRALWRAPLTRLASQCVDVARALPRLGVARAARALFEIRYLQASGALDAEGYLAHAWDVAAAGQDPVSHYVLFGAREMRDPAPGFSTLGYLSRYPDVATRGVNPFVHFLRHGRREGRTCGGQVFSRAFSIPAAHGTAISKGGEEDIAAAPLDNAGRQGPAVATVGAPAAHQGGSQHSGAFAEASFLQPAPANPYDLRPDQMVSEEARQGQLFVDRYRLFAASPDWQGAVDAINRLQPFACSAEVAASVIVPVYGQLAYTLNCLHALASHKSLRAFEIIVVDDGSPDETRHWVSKVTCVRLIERKSNSGFIDSCNEGAGAARGGHIVLLNNDTRVVAGWLDELLDTFSVFPNAGLVGSKLFYPDASLQEAGGIIWRDGSAWNYGRNDDPGRPEYCYAREVDYVSGASIAVPTPLWRTVGGFDVRYRPAYGEDSDLSLRLRYTYGKSVVFQALSRVIHYEGKTSGTDTAQGAKSFQVANARRLFETWAPSLASHRANGEQAHLEKDRGVKKRALVLDATTPAPDEDAGSVTCVGLMRTLREAGFKVTFLAEDNLLFLPGRTAALQREGIEVVYLPYARSVDKFLADRGEEFDLVLVFRVDVAARRLKKLRSVASRAKIVFHASDLHFLREERRLEITGASEDRAAVEKLRRHELGVVGAVDAVVVHSTFEAELLRDVLPSARVFVWPWVLDAKPVRSGFEARSGVGFLGGYRHPPNVDAVRHFVETIWPHVRARRNDLHFYVAGSEAPEEILAMHGRDGVEVLGHVVDLEDFFSRLRLSVAPIRYGAGIKGKVGMSLAYGVPGVLTPCAAEGMGLEDGACVLIRDDPAAFAEAIIELHDDAGRWIEMSRNAQSYVTQTYGSALAPARLRALLELAGVSKDLLD